MAYSKERWARVQIALRDAELDAVDRRAGETHMSRVLIIRLAIRKFFSLDKAEPNPSSKRA